LGLRGLIAVTLLLLAPLITVGPADLAVLVATAAFALAMPLDVARTFGDVGPDLAASLPALDARAAQRQRRTGRVLQVSLALVALSGVLAVIGMVAVPWHMAWWIAGAFLALVVISLVIVSVVMAAAQPPDAAAAPERRRGVPVDARVAPHQAGIQ